MGSASAERSSATAYTDFGLFTADDAITADVNDLMNDFTGDAARPGYGRLLVAPGTLLPGVLALIRRETDHAAAGRPAGIRARMNGLDDAEVIAALYEASRAGVDVRLAVRGICCLRPGVPGLSERIRVVSMLGRFLEHARVLHVVNGGNDEYFIGSADWRERNLRRRIEAAAPVTDADARKRIDHGLTAVLADSTAWDLQVDGTCRRRPGGRRGAQEALLDEAVGARGTIA